jgi:hypothetical protein
MSRGAHNSAHRTNGKRSSRAGRLYGKLGKTIPLGRLERLLGEGTKRSMREVKHSMGIKDEVLAFLEKVHAHTDSEAMKAEIDEMKGKVEAHFGQAAAGEVGSRGDAQTA